MKAKLIIGGALLGLVLILLIQNTQVVTYRFFFWYVSISQIFLVPVMLLIGFLLGILTAGLLRKRSKSGL